MRLRDYQQAAVEGALDRFAKGDQRTLWVIPTGGGKTICFAHLAKQFIDNGLGRVLVLVHREELAQQAAAKLHAITGLKASIEMGLRWSTETGFAEHKSPLVIASIQTMVSGSNGTRRMHRFAPRDFGLVIQDEAHHCPAKTFTDVCNYFCQNDKLKFLGCTATPDRKDGEAMGQIFQSVAYNYTLPQIIEDGYLVPIRQRRVYVDGLDFSTCRTTAGDLNQADLEEAMTFEAPLHGVVYATIELACDLPKDSLRTVADAGGEAAAMLEGKRPRKCLVFATSVKHAQRMADVFNRWIPDSADVITGDLLPEDRAEVLRSYEVGETRFLVGCMVPTEGFDSPSTEIVVMARPTKSRSLYSQMLGRGTRPAESIAHHLGQCESAEERRQMIADSDKPCATILDFVGNSGRHDLVCTADILGVEYDEAVVDAARRAAQEHDVDMREALKEAQEDFEQKKRESEERKRKEEEARRLRTQAEEARRAKLRGVASYEMEDVESPGYRSGAGLFSADGRSFRVDLGEAGDGTDRPTASQMIWLRDKGKLSERNLKKMAGMGRKAAGALQAAIMRRFSNRDLPTGNQLMLMYGCGVPKEVYMAATFERASEIIDSLSKNGWRWRA